jgi:uncharacterized membrane protein YfcA
MTLPVQIELFGSLYYLHYFFEVMAFFIGIRLYYYLKKGIVDPISDENRLWILLGAMVGALLGSRLVALLEDPDNFRHLTLSINLSK